MTNAGGHTVQPAATRIGNDGYPILSQVLTGDRDPLVFLFVQQTSFVLQRLPLRWR
jgi:hypothetical protein